MVDHLEGVAAPVPAAPGAAGPYTVHDRRVRIAGPATPATPAERAAADPRFARLRRRFLVQTVLLTTAVLGWYFAYLFLSAYERAFMARQVVGSVNVALLFGIGQFASTFVLAWAFTAYAARRVDPLAADIRAAAGAPDTPVATDGGRR
ncbi:DUF485 domain-containing protein [Nocardiopsis trehalosi]|uniref:DUF485 domain-containing protein n=1 Tax=Nocardiopsis trehalosi TaxID=109329 RepID=UPI000AB8E468|nr:DUF485 domain-containing protein [Nocardiopsis trehalosi]